jgi:lysozyme
MLKFLRRLLGIMPKASSLSPTLIEVDLTEVDEALANDPILSVIEPKPELPPVTHPAIPYKVSKDAIDLLHHFEGLARVMPDGLVRSYLCPAKVWTIGWGATGRDPFNGGQIGPNTVWTREQADERFMQHLRQFEQDTRASLKVPTTQAQFDALVSFAYNLGNGALNRSTLLRLHNAGDFEGAAKQFARWDKAGGKVLRGLTRRREAETRLYRGHDWRGA